MSSAARHPAPARRLAPRLATQEALWGYLFVAPNFLLVLAFAVFPVAASFLISMAEWNLIIPPRFVGLGNYAHLMQDPVFLTVLANTVYYTAGTLPLTLAGALALATLLTQGVRGLAWYRTAYFLPVISSMVAVGLVWAWFYEPDYGPLNAVLRGLGLPAPRWLAEPEWAMPAVILTSVWKNLGFYVVLFVAGLREIPQTLYEAAEMDGATPWQRFWRITLPLLTPTLFFAVIMNLIWSFQVFDQVYVMTDGGPARATSVLVFYLYENAFRWFRMGRASAVAYVLFSLIFAVTLLQWRLRRRWVYGEDA